MKLLKKLWGWLKGLFRDEPETMEQIKDRQW
jgi:hypothetical protein